MNRFLIPLLALLGCAPAHAQRPASGTAPVQPAAHGDLRVDADWIRLPHRTAAKLLSEATTAKDLASLREKVVKLVGTGEATRVDLLSTSLQEASRVRVENAVVFPYPDSYWPPIQASFIWPDGRKSPGEVAPMIADSFESHNLGRALMAEYRIMPRSGRLEYEIGLESVSHEANQTWGTHPRQRTVAVVFRQSI